MISEFMGHSDSKATPFSNKNQRFQKNSLKIEIPKKQSGHTLEALDEVLSKTDDRQQHTVSVMKMNKLDQTVSIHQQVVRDN